MTRRAALLSLCLLLIACEGTESGWKFQFERMQDQPRYEAYASSDFFADGRAMRTPPAGTVSRERIVGRPLLTQGSVDGAPAERIPIPLTPDALEVGRRSFDVTCAACHGVLGDGDTPVARNMRLRPPPSLHEPRLAQLAPGELYGVISEGYGLMPSYANHLTVGERWAVVAYVRALQLSRRVPLGALPPAVRDSLLRLPEGR